MFRIGDFSKLSQVSIRMLRHYDQIGLLAPAHVDPDNGYRYYSADQLVTVNRILAMQDLGLTLSQIRRLIVEEVSAGELVGMLRLEHARAEQQRSDLDQRLVSIEDRLSRLQDHGAPDSPDLVEKAVPSIPFLSYRVTSESTADAVDLVMEILEEGRISGLEGNLVVVSHDPFYDDRDIDLEIGFATQSKKVDLLPDVTLSPGRLPAVDRMVSMANVGTAPESHRAAHNALGAWLASHGAVLDGPGREIVHETATDDEFVVEIQYPVRER